MIILRADCLDLALGRRRDQRRRPLLGLPQLGCPSPDASRNISPWALIGGRNCWQPPRLSASAVLLKWYELILLGTIRGLSLGLATVKGAPKPRSIQAGCR